MKTPTYLKTNIASVKKAAPQIGVNIMELTKNKLKYSFIKK